MNEQITSAAELDALTDLVVRLNRANKGLLSQSRTNITSERTRLEGKAEGVRLALSYVEEAIRARPDQPQRVQPSRERVVAALKGVWFNLSDEFLGRFADAALALFAQQPTVAEVKAEALREAAREFRDRLPDGTGNGRAYNSWRVGQMLDQRADILAPQPHEADSIEREARS